MDTISLGDLLSYHNIDRNTFFRLVTIRMCDPGESLLVIAVWFWLEKKGNCPKIIIEVDRKLRNFIRVNDLVFEAVSVLNCLASNQPPVAPNGGLISTSELMKMNLSLQIIYQHRFAAIDGIKEVLNSVFAKIFNHILPPEMGIQVPGFPYKLFCDVEIVRRAMNYTVATGELCGGVPDNIVSEDDRTMFLTFSRGYLVTETEVRALFSGILFGHDSVTGVHMQENVSVNAQPLFARLVLSYVTTVDRILNGRSIAKFRVNGKDVWARKYERRD